MSSLGRKVCCNFIILMITNEMAIQLAKDFCLSQSEVASNIFYDFGSLQDFGELFYFDFKIVNKEGQPSSEMVGGAPGFTISKHRGDIRIIGWQQYQELRNKGIH